MQQVSFQANAKQAREALIKRGFNDLPFYYTYVSPYSVVPSLTWVCDLDEDKKITAVYMNLKTNEKVAMYPKDILEAISYRNQLIERNWVAFTPPEPQITENENAPPIPDELILPHHQSNEQNKE